MSKDNFMRKGGVVKALAIGDDDMEQINALALEPLTKEQVYTFEVVACDNDIDRDFERFGDEALEQMAKLLTGKTVIKDHERMADYQFARIYAAEVQDAAGMCSDGIPLKQLVCRCYTLANDTNAQIISEIKAGIKKEVSVSFMPTTVECSICGTDRRKDFCKHWWGKEYDGAICHFKFGNVSDAYELSFVAVPAQRNAGTRKDYTFGEEPEDDKPNECEPDEEKPDGCKDSEDPPGSDDSEGDLPDDDPEDSPPDEGDDPDEKKARERAFFMSKELAIAEAYMATKED